jgi:serine/threonine-protein kinase
MSAEPRQLQGRNGIYEIHGKLGSGGMSTVHVAGLMGWGGVSRVVAVKRLHADLAQNPAFVSMFLDEARIAARIRHANVVATLEVLEDRGELFQIMECVAGETLARLHGAATPPIPLPIASTIVCGILHGLHAAHRARVVGELLQVVHRDVSPSNVLVGVDGVARVLDFGVAKACGRSYRTPGGEIKGNLAYMAPEQLSGTDVSPQADIYAAGVVLWELVVGRRLRTGDATAMIRMALTRDVPPPSALVDDIGPGLDEVIAGACATNPRARFESAEQMAEALEAALPPATQRDVARYVCCVARDALAAQSQLIMEAERASSLRAVTPSPSSAVKPIATGLEAETSATAPSGARSARFGDATLVSSGHAAAEHRAGERLLASRVSENDTMVATPRGVRRHIVYGQAFPRTPHAPPASATSSPVPESYRPARRAMRDDSRASDTEPGRGRAKASALLLVGAIVAVLGWRCSVAASGDGRAGTPAASGAALGVGP